MPRIIWNEFSDRFYETGIDRGVLYDPDGIGVPWNGLISVTEKVSGTESTPIYYDGVKYGDHLSLGDYAATLRAYTYPEEFLQFEGTVDVGNGLYAANQQPLRFGLSYRTRIANEEEGINLGYKLHILYNLIAVPSDRNYQTLTEGSAMEFEWTISAIPGEVPGFRPTAHLIFDSRRMSPILLSDIEDSLYGDNVNPARLPPISSLVNFVDAWVVIRITDNGDGTWTAEGPDDLIAMLDETTFQITQANATYLDANTYMISSSTF